jgi:hypothetical protein
MKMYYEEFGDYEMSNTVVEYQADRLIAWEPSRRDVEEESWHYRWRYELVPDEDGATVVTESFDLSRSPEEARQATKDGTTWTEAMTETLERLDRLRSRRQSARRYPGPRRRYRAVDDRDQEPVGPDSRLAR